MLVKGEDSWSEYLNDSRPNSAAKVTLGTLKKIERNKDNDKWEINRMISSGTIRVKSQDVELEEEDSSRVMLLVQNIKPPFLDGRFIFTTQIEPVQVVKDKNSDIATMARRGSAIVKLVRERNERNKMRDKFWGISGPIR